MRIDGIAGIYNKTYLDNDMYRFDYSRYIFGSLDTETGIFYDELDNQIPFIRDLAFLDSREIVGHHGFIPFEQLPSVYEDIEDAALEDYCYAFDEELKSSMLIVTVLDDYDNKKQNTVLTVIDLFELHKKALKFYMSFVDENGHPYHKSIYDASYDLPVESIIGYVRGGEYNYEELKMFLERYRQQYEDSQLIMSELEDIINEISNGVNKLNIEGRNPNFDINGDLDTDIILEVLDKRQITIEEIKVFYDYFDTYLKEMNELFKAINTQLERIEEKRNELDVQVTLDKNQTDDESVEEVIEKYTLDDLKELRSVIQEYLVGQDEPLRRLLSELARMKDKEFEDNVGILLSGDSGVGKTFMVQLIAKYLDVPFVRVDTTDLTVPGYVGRDLEEVLWELYENSGKDKKKAEHGIIFFDEIDKKGSNRKDDISGMGVLNHLLTLIDGSDVYACKSTKSITSQSEIKLNSKHMIIIAAGSFPDVYKNKKRVPGFNVETSDVDVPNKTPNTNEFVQKAMMSPDFMNRLPIRIRLNSLTEEDFEENFIRGKDSPLKWEEKSFSKQGVKLTATTEFIKKASKLSLDEDSGFRGSKGIILTATSAALDEVKEKKGRYSEIVLTDKTLDNPYVYKKVKKL